MIIKFIATILLLATPLILILLLVSGVFAGSALFIEKTGGELALWVFVPILILIVYFKRIKRHFSRPK
jgi:hypothetical protein